MISPKVRWMQALLTVTFLPCHAPLAVAQLPTRPDSGRTLYRSESSSQPTPLRVVVRDSLFFRELWARVLGDPSSGPQLPRVDFQTQQVIFLALGSRPTHEEEIAVDSVTADGIVLVHRWLVASGCVTSPTFTSPLTIVAVPRTLAISDFSETVEIIVSCALPSLQLGSVRPTIPVRVRVRPPSPPPV